jgi:hypothetical protein
MDDKKRFKLLGNWILSARGLSLFVCKVMERLGFLKCKTGLQYWYSSCDCLMRKKDFKLNFKFYKKLEFQFIDKYFLKASKT